MATNDFRSPTCRIDFRQPACLAQRTAKRGDGGDGGASRDDAYATAGTLVECFGCSTCALAPRAAPFLIRSTFAVVCSTAAVERKATRWDCCCKNSTTNSSKRSRSLSSKTSLNATRRNGGGARSC